MPAASTPTPLRGEQGRGEEAAQGSAVPRHGPTAGKKTATATSWSSWSQGCSEINFVTGDWIRGPFHTNDMR